MSEYVPSPKSTAAVYIPVSPLSLNFVPSSIPLPDSDTSAIM